MNKRALFQGGSNAYSAAKSREDHFNLAPLFAKLCSRGPPSARREGLGLNVSGSYKACRKIRLLTSAFAKAHFFPSPSLFLPTRGVFSGPM